MMVHSDLIINSATLAKSTSAKKLIIVGTVAAVCAVSAVLYSGVSEQREISFLG